MNDFCPAATDLADLADAMDCTYLAAAAYAAEVEG